MKKLIALLLSLALGLQLAACGAAPASGGSAPASEPASAAADGTVQAEGMLWPVTPLPEKTKLTVSYLANSTAEAVTYLAQQKGWLEACNLEVEMVYFAGGPAQMEASTSWDVGTSGIGGMITGFSLNGEEDIWTRHPNFSECNRPRFGVPVLFPSCGNPDNGVHIFDGKAYPMETHGFADLCAWEVDSVGPDGVTLALESTPLTKFLYPFDFTLLLNYNLEGNKALVSLTVINEGNTDMPFSFGYHPYFTASKLENVEFDIKCATCSDNAKGEQPAAPEKITLTRKEGADNSVRLLTGVQFPMTLTDKGNGHKVTVDADETFENGVLWQQDAESFVCMEPWNGWANSVNEDGKHEVLEPDEAMTSEWSITIEKA